MGQSNVSLSILLSGAVQGVGLRPRVKRWADQCAIAGWVRNDGDQVRLHVQGDPQAMTAFLDLLRNHLSDIAVRQVPALLQPCDGFAIEAGVSQPASALWQLPADRGICEPCQAEFHDPSNRRYQYPFISCNDCGPRFSILHRLPFSRDNTAYGRWQPCARCQAEFAHPDDRRFHSELICCPDCGPQLQLWNGERLQQGGDVLEQAVACLQEGRILALKAQTAVQLLCRADDAAVVARLRQYKARRRKPLALLVASLEQARQLALLDEQEAALLQSPQRPIVLAAKRTAADIPVADNVAPDVPDWGLLLPVTGLHLALLQRVGQPLVCTSANRSGEPVLYDNATVMATRGLFDLALLHDVDIGIPQDDSLLMHTAGNTMTLRRARSYAHEKFSVPVTEPALALGGDLKHSFALGRNGCAILSPYIGDLDSIAVQARQQAVLEKLMELHAIDPVSIRCDGHRGYHSHQQAHQWSHQQTVASDVQHHLAHVMANHYRCPLPDRYLALVWDGAGWGEDGTLWGSEAFLVENGLARRVASLWPFSLPGADQAARQPWRMALSLSFHSGRPSQAALDCLHPAVSEEQRRVVHRLLVANINNPPTCSMGRLFDAVSHLVCGSCEQDYEGEAALQLQALASRCEGASPWHFDLQTVEHGNLLLGDWRPAWQRLCEAKSDHVSPSQLALGFHQGLIDWAIALSHHLGTKDLSISGGCFQNRVLQSLLAQQAITTGIRIHWPTTVPVNDGGLALGQLVVPAR